MPGYASWLDSACLCGVEEQALHRGGPQIKLNHDDCGTAAGERRRDVISPDSSVSGGTATVTYGCRPVSPGSSRPRSQPPAPAERRACQSRPQPVRRQVRRPTGRHQHWRRPGLSAQPNRRDRSPAEKTARPGAGRPWTRTVRSTFARPTTTISPPTGSTHFAVVCRRHAAKHPDQSTYINWRCAYFRSSDAIFVGRRGLEPRT